MFLCVLPPHVTISSHMLYHTSLRQHQINGAASTATVNPQRVAEAKPVILEKLLSHIWVEVMKNKKDAIYIIKSPVPDISAESKW